MSVRIARVTLALSTLLSLPALASLPDFSAMTETRDSAFLEADSAFQLQGRYSGEHGVDLVWHVAQGYYLYRDRIRIQRNGTELAHGFDHAAELKDDPSFGRVAVFHHQVAATLPLQASDSLVVQYQGCADDGLCYPPETRRLHLENRQLVIEKVSSLALKPQVVATPPSSGHTAPAADDARGISAFLGTAALPLVLLTFFLLGLGLSLTPCVFPMLPILTGIIAGEGQRLDARRGTALSLAYVTGMSLSYAAVGMAIGFFGARANLQAWLQTPAVLAVFAGIFVLLALSMFGFYELQLPAPLRDRLGNLSQRQKGGSLWGTGAMGAVSALVVSPCVSAPLAGTLMYISSTGNALLGGAALFLLGLGMGAPLVLIGLTGGKLLPRSGAWMEAVKHVFGVGLLGVAVWLLARIVPGPVALLLWALLVAGSAIYMGALEPAGYGWPRLRKTVGILMLLYSLLLLIGVVTRQDDPLHPLAGLMVGSAATASQGNAAPQFTRVRSLQDLEHFLANAREAGKPVVMDLYADWCTACKSMEREVFPDRTIRDRLTAFATVQLDLTENTPEQRALLDRYRVFGPPALLFFTPQARWLSAETMQGEPSVDLLARRLEQVRRQL